jgi:hypothetical protein
MLRCENARGWKFVWPEGSPYIEIFHTDAPYPEIPVYVYESGKMRYNESDLKRLANETPEFGRSYEST